MSPIEKIARALCDDTLSRWRSPLGVQSEPWREFIPAARAVLQAIREPSEGMEDAAYKREAEQAGGPLSPGDCWQAMIDAALTE